MKVLALATVATLALATGCASEGPPAPGDIMIAQAQGTEQLGQQWNDGSRMASKARSDLEAAEKDAARAERDAAEARKRVEDARARLAQGEKMMADAESEYAARFPGRTLRGQ